jgi:predicted ribosome quality control (RQC) complex YloA/Tae2 family protein
LLDGRVVALANLKEAEANGGRAGEWQRIGELILAYGPAAGAGVDLIQAWDYEGNEIGIPVDPELDFKRNAEAYFVRAKKAKGRLGFVREQIERLSEEVNQIRSAVLSIESETQLNRLENWQATARSRRWLHHQEPVAKNKEDRPYEGHRIREALAPGGYTVLYGENAESNDYLTLRVAKPNDYWLHVRGATSAHVVIATRNQPERVQPETLRYAAKLAVLNSTSKHAGYVPVDYTLKKYVRKPRGAAKGSAIYTHEKTIHVETDAS